MIGSTYIFQWSQWLMVPWTVFFNQKLRNEEVRETIGMDFNTWKKYLEIDWYIDG